MVRRLRFLGTGAGQVAVGLFVGACGSLGYPGVGIWPCYWLALSVLAWQLMSRQHHWPISCFVAGFVVTFFVAPFAATIAWGHEVPFAVGLCAASTTAPILIWIRITAHRRVGLTGILAGAFCLAIVSHEAAEWLKLPYSSACVLVDQPLLTGGARLIGGAGVAGLFWILTIIPAWLVTHWRGRANQHRLRFVTIGAWCAVAMTLLAMGGLAQLSAPDATGSLTVGVPQVNAGQTFYDSQSVNRRLRVEFEQQFDAMLRELKGVDLLVTTEEFDNRYHLHFAPLRRAWQQLARESGSAVLLSSPTWGTSGRQNTVAGIDRNGAIVGVYHKVDLAPFGETQRQAGSDYQPLAVLPGNPVGALICLESGFYRAAASMVRQGATLLATTTSDISFNSSPVVFFHLAMSRLHAIETGREMVWASNGGPSGIIDRWGGFAAAAPFREPRAARFEAKLHRGLTPYLQFRAPLVIMAAIVLVMLIAHLLIRQPSGSIRRIDSPSRQGKRARWVVAVSVPLVLAAGGAISFWTPALVELRHGAPHRAYDAAFELWRQTDPYLPQADPLAPFDPLDHHYTAAAVAYHLSALGFYRTAGQLTSDCPRQPSPREMREYLAGQLGYEARTIPLDSSLTVPMTQLVQLPDQTWCAVDPLLNGSVAVYLPQVRERLLMSNGEYLQRLKPVAALVPAPLDSTRF